MANNRRKKPEMKMSGGHPRKVDKDGPWDEPFHSFTQDAYRLRLLRVIKDEPGLKMKEVLRLACPGERQLYKEVVHTTSRRNYDMLSAMLSDEGLVENSNPLDKAGRNTNAALHITSDGKAALSDMSKRGVTPDDVEAKHLKKWPSWVSKWPSDSKSTARKKTIRKAARKSAEKPESKVHDRGKEKDGLSWGRSGEGKNHRALRLWVKKNPDRIAKRFRGVRAETEVELLSGDRVDVVLYAERKTVAIEVKSRDSNCADLQRGVYQCVKYRAVLCAQSDHLPVESWLVTESGLEGDLKALARKLGIKHKVVSRM